MSPAQSAFQQLLEQYAEDEPSCGWHPDALGHILPADFKIIIQAYGPDIWDDFSATHTHECGSDVGDGNYLLLGFFVGAYLERKAREYLLKALKEIEWDRADSGYWEQRRADAHVDAQIIQAKETLCTP